MTQPSSHLKHWYLPPSADSPDDPINVYAGPLQLGLGGTTVKAEGYVRLEWAPTPHVVWHAASDEREITQASLEDLMAPPDEPKPVGPPASPTVPLPPPLGWRAPDHSVRAVRLSSFIGNPPVGAGGMLQSVTFFVANNLTPLNGWPIEDADYVWGGRLPLRGGGWEIDLDARRERAELQAWLKSSGGYTVTHVGRLRRVDGSDFAPAAALDALALLQTVLSFAAGRHVSCLLPVGYDHTGTPVWSSWRMPLLDPWSGAQHVADLHYPNHWVELFQCLAAIWDDKFKSEEVLYRAFRFCLDASYGATLQLAASTAQAGLELLAYTFLVEDHALLSSGQYRSRDAHENFSDYLTQHLIDDSINATETPELASAAARVGCATGPELVTRMRNGVIHPSRRKAKFKPAEWLEARQLLLRYLILGILAYVDYQGSYRDPLDKGKWMGTVAKVPWA